MSPKCWPHVRALSSGHYITWLASLQDDAWYVSWKLNNGDRRSASLKGRQTQWNPRLLVSRDHGREVAQLLLPGWAGLLTEVVTDTLFAVSASLGAQHPKLLIKQTFIIIQVSGKFKPLKTETLEGRHSRWLIPYPASSGVHYPFLPISRKLWTHQLSLIGPSLHIFW